MLITSREEIRERARAAVTRTLGRGVPLVNPYCDIAEPDHFAAWRDAAVDCLQSLVAAEREGVAA